MLKTWLRKKGFEVDTAGNAARARKFLSGHNYNLILSDLRLPDQDGIHLLTELRKQNNQTPYIIMNKRRISSIYRRRKRNSPSTV